MVAAAIHLTRRRPLANESDLRAGDRLASLANGAGCAVLDELRRCRRLGAVALTRLSG